MSSENGKFHANPSPMPAMLSAAKIKREPSSMFLTNGNCALPKFSSFAPARDLTLGGRGPLGAVTKKVFTPNLNVVRNKNTNVKTSKDTTARGRGRGKSERGRGGASGRGRGGANSTLIQTTGVFSEGAGAINIRKTNGSGSNSYSRSVDDAPSALCKPMIIKREHQKIDIQAEAAHVRELLGASDEDEFDDEKTDLEKIPIKLNEEKTVTLVQQIQQKQMQQRSMGCIPRYPSSIEELLDSRQSQIFLMQLPDTLPCEEDGTDSPEKLAPGEPKEQPGDSSLSTPATKSSSSSLKNMEEGQVGKLIRYKSGKIKLLLGESYFDLNMGMETGFLQDLMSINTNREERSGNMINLGAIQAKLTATPDWEFMLKQQP